MRPKHYAAILLLCGLVGCGESPGGMPPSYAAKDFDPRLMKMAATATPIIAAVQRYRVTHGSFPPDLKSFRDGLPTSVIVGHDLADGWRYSRSEGGLTFHLVTKLGWDPCLIYEATATNFTWTFDPGDGSDKKEVKLQP
jgi:hypothetical protein